MKEQENINVSELTQVESQYHYIVSELIQRRKGVFSQKEIADFLQTSRSSIVRLENLELLDLLLLEKYCGILGYDLEINIKETI